MSNETERIKARIRKTLEEAGLTDRVGKTFRPSNHSCGLPFNQACVLIKPDWSPVDGDHAIAVTATEVATYGLRTPYNHNNWVRLAGAQYKTPEQMVELVKGLIGQPTGCW